MDASLMNEGLEKDDRFRMVEDEFLDAAKQFTQHLHAAEYQRLKKAARSQNAAAINSISRPVTIQMPDETRRKVEGVARAKKHAAVVQSVLGKGGRGSGTEEDSDGNGGAWLGTALHGLMESPGRSAASLTEIGRITTSTRAAAGFAKPRPQKTFKRFISSSPQLESFRLPKEKARPQSRVSSESSDDDDDLDAAVRVRMQPKFDEANKVIVRPGHRVLQQDSKELLSKPATDVSVKASSSEALEDNTGTLSHVSISARERIAKRLEQAKLRQAKEEQEPRKKVEIIPLFLS
jgi:hypothetical protein